MKYRLFLTLFGISLIGCISNQSAISVFNFDSKSINSLGIIYEGYSVVNYKTIGLPERNNDSEYLLQSQTNDLLKTYLTRNSLNLIQIPDSVKTKREIAVLDDEIRKVIKTLNFRERKKIKNLDYILDINLQRYSDIVQSNYLVFWKIGGWNHSKVGKALDAMAGFQSNDYLIFQICIVEANTSKILWYCEKSGMLNPENKAHVTAVIKSAIYNFIYKIDVKPESFLFTASDEEFTIYMKDKSKIIGIITEVDGFSIVVKDQSNNIHNVELKDVSSIQSRFQNRIIYPRKT